MAEKRAARRTQWTQQRRAAIPLRACDLSNVTRAISMLRVSSMRFLPFPRVHRTYPPTYPPTHLSANYNTAALRQQLQLQERHPDPQGGAAQIGITLNPRYTSFLSHSCLNTHLHNGLFHVGLHTETVEAAAPLRFHECRVHRLVVILEVDPSAQSSDCALPFTRKPVFAGCMRPRPTVTEKPDLITIERHSAL